MAISGYCTLRAGRDDIIVHNLRSYFGCMGGRDRRDYDCQSTNLDAESNTTPVVDSIAIIIIKCLSEFCIPSFCDTVSNNKEKAARKFKIKSSISSVTGNTV